MALPRPRLFSFLAFGLFLGQEILAAEGLLPAPSISVEPGRVSRRGSNVTIVCRAQGGFDLLRLEECSPEKSCSTVQNEANNSTSKTEARFQVTLVNTGHYCCIYQKSSAWSSRSKILELPVSSIDVTQSSKLPASSLPSDCTTPRVTQTPVDDSHLAAHGLEVQHVYLLIGASVSLLLLLLLLVLFCLRHQRQNKQGPPRQQDQEQRSQERCSLARVSLGRTADRAATDQPLPQGREQDPSGPQEVTYAQLDHRALTLRGAPEVSPQSMVESSTYAVLARHGPSPRGSCT